LISPGSAAGISAGGTPTNEHHVRVCTGVVDADALETGVVGQRRHVASGKTPKRWWSCSIRRGCPGTRNAIAKSTVRPVAAIHAD
jgi:hypothetical protein